MRHLVPFAIAALAAALPAKADWQYTAWGMTRDEVVVAAQGKAKIDNGDEGSRVWGLDRGVTGTFAENGVDYGTEFYFDRAGKLAAIRIGAPDPSQCGAYRTAVEAVYGKPERAENVSPLANATMFYEYWRDTAHGNGVRFSRLASGKFEVCFAAYVPIASMDARGIPHF